MAGGHYPCKSAGKIKTELSIEFPSFLLLQNQQGEKIIN
jgi:hypothetical protein